ncbi:MAG: hypothetical protein V4657_07410 [Pseudomonadota bacterium]
MTPFDPRLTIIATEAKVKTCHVFHCWSALQAMGKNFHVAAFAHFAGLEDRHVEAILSALETHDALPAGKGRGSTGKTIIAANWTPPPVSELPPQARSCAEQWTSASYATHGEAFRSYWRSHKKMMSDWSATWANRIVTLHSQVMRDQKFGNAPTHSPFEIPAPQRSPLEIAHLELKTAKMLGQTYEAEVAQRKIDRLSNVIPFNRPEGELLAQMASK